MVVSRIFRTFGLVVVSDGLIGCLSFSLSVVAEPSRWQLQTDRGAVIAELVAHRDGDKISVSLNASETVWRAAFDSDGNIIAGDEDPVRVGTDL